MLTTKPHLRTRRPSPTTVEYTISNKPPPSITTTILRLFIILIRTLLLSSSALLLLVKFHPPSTKPSSQQSAVTTATILILASPLGHLAQSLTTSLSTPFLSALILIIAYLSLLRVHTTESLLVLRGLGIQTSSSLAKTLLAGRATRFIPTEKIRDVLLNEAFAPGGGFEVRYVLVIVVEGEEDMVVVFPGLRPRKDIVLTVWRGVRACLWEGKGEGINGKVWDGL